MQAAHVVAGHQRERLGQTFKPAHDVVQVFVPTRHVRSAPRGFIDREWEAARFDHGPESVASLGGPAFTLKSAECKVAVAAFEQVGSAQAANACVIRAHPGQPQVFVEIV